MDNQIDISSGYRKNILYIAKHLKKFSKAKSLLDRKSADSNIFILGTLTFNNKLF